MNSLEEEYLRAQLQANNACLCNISQTEEFMKMFRGQVTNAYCGPKTEKKEKKKELVDTFSKLLEEVLTDAYNSGYEKGLIDGSPYRS